MKPFSIKPLNSFQIIVLGFAGVILAGALLLMLPVSSATHCVTPFLSALFTSTTSVCVTGLIVVDTGTYWSVFGQAVILVLIQIGGMGVVTVAAAVTIVSGRKIGLMQRSTMQEAVAAPKMSGIVPSSSTTRTSMPGTGRPDVVPFFSRASQGRTNTWGTLSVEPYTSHSRMP